LQRQPQRLDHFQDGGELGVAVGGERAVQALAARAGVFGQLHHAACALYHAQGVLRQSGVASLQAFLKVLLHVVLGLQGGGAVVALDAQGFACVLVHVNRRGVRRLATMSLRPFTQVLNWAVRSISSIAFCNPWITERQMDALGH
jgi:hypothetical protein